MVGRVESGSGVADVGTSDVLSSVLPLLFGINADLTPVCSAGSSACSPANWASGASRASGSVSEVVEPMAECKVAHLILTSFESGSAFIERFNARSNNGLSSRNGSGTCDGDNVRVGESGRGSQDRCVRGNVLPIESSFDLISVGVDGACTLEVCQLTGEVPCSGHAETGGLNARIVSREEVH